MPKTTVKPKLVVRQNREFLREGPEICVFLACLGMVNELRALKVEFKEGTLAQTVFLERCNAVVAQFTDTVEATERFDIVLPVMEFGRFSPFFWSWFNWWDDYVKELSPRQVTQIERLARQHAAALEQRRPGGHWLRHRRGPAFTMVSG